MSLGAEEQIVKQISWGIESDRMNVGEQLPSAQALAAELRIDLDLVVRAYKELEKMNKVKAERMDDDTAVLFIRKPPEPPCKQLFLKVLCAISGNGFIQQLLEKIVDISQYAMGIGSGGFPLTSGERAIFSLMTRYISPPYCIFDVGAHKGHFFKLILDNLPMCKYQIHCFEPGRITFQFLKRNTPEDEWLRLNNTALGKEKGKTILYYDDAGSGRASLTPLNMEHFCIEFNQSESIRMDTVDHYCETNRIDRIHLLKLDIEGHEMGALEGALVMLYKKAIDIVTFEFGKADVDTRYFFKDFYYFFKGKGMKIYRITPSEYLVPVESYREINEQYRTTNFLAIRRGIIK